MNIKDYQLPEPGQTKDVWSVLAAETRPIVVYGMGNGADKLLSRFAAYGIRAADFFASDGFVRGHSFHGKRVLSYAEIREEYRDFVVVLSFASARPEVLRNLFSMSESVPFYMPDLPVAGGEFFDAAFYARHYHDLCEAQEMLADEESRRVFADVVRYKLSGDIRELRRHTQPKEKTLQKLLGGVELHCAVDAGAYNGDSARLLLSVTSCREIYAIEADRKNFSRLEKYAAGETRAGIHPIYGALSDRCEPMYFAVGGNRNSSFDNPSFQHRTEEVEGMTLDRLQLCPDYIKYDIEGAEAAALRGSLKTIAASRPILSVSAYHRSADLYELPFLCRQICPDYRFYLRRELSLPAWDLDLICIPMEREKGV